MALFQKTVEQKYLKQLDSELINAKYLEFKTHFGNTDIQENIRNSKEEQYQEGFLRELFVKILGYKLNPTPNFNLTTEYKNIKDSKKADGAIIINDSVKAVIELKGTNTTDLGKIETQAFGYKNNQSGCVYVVTSNFEKLRFYIDNAIEYIEFNLFQLSKADFEILYLCLSFESIEKGIPKKVKEESLSQEDVITEKLYQDYSLFKRELHQNLVSLNPQFDSLTLFKKSQKLLDRFLFLFFAEDRHLLPPNSVRLILNDWRDLQERDVEIPLYQRFKKYFEYLNTGYKGKRYDVFAYNGGLFKPDEVLDTILIDDELLFRHTYNLSEYDFASEIDVNILGHIFENSLNELDEINAQLAGQEIDKTKTKRKKDGVFYTPKYITKYIVENTIGKLCEEKKQQIGIVNEISFERKKNGKLTQKAKDYFALLESYRAWLKQITIIDPACGSGAFLNQSLEFLLSEHAFISNQLQSITGDLSTMFVDIEKSILENNLFGVDLNEESVEIAKLSLWLRTAQPNRKLNDLSNNIKCGNSLIADPAVAGGKAFNWQQSFPQVFEKGGFDVVIGNPPYVQLQSMGEMSEILKNCGYETFDKGADLYCLFTERGYSLLKNGGLQSFIMPNKWMLVAYGKPLRKFLSKTGLRQVLNFGDIQFFQEATTYVCIFVTQKSEPSENVKVLSLNQKTYHGDFMTEVESNLYNYPMSNFGDTEWSIQPYNDARKLEQMKLNSTELKDLPINIYRGILTGYNDAFYIGEETSQKLVAADPKSAELIKPMVRGRDIFAYGISDSEFLINVHNGIKEKNPPLPPIRIDDYPAIKEHLDAFYPMLEKRGDKGDTPYNLRNCAYLEEFAKPKIIYPEITAFFPFMYDERGIFSNNKNFILTAIDDSVSLLFLTALFNSSLAKLWIWYNCPELQGGTREIRKVYFEHFPVPQATEEQTAKLAQYAIERTQLTADLQTLCSKFTRNIQREFNLEKLPAKLENWFQLSFNEFLKELEKSKVKLSLSQKAEWEDYFLQESKKALEIKHQIDTTDKEIDQMVYELYGLNEEEIRIIGNS
jgi:type I restriction-modification system DNA methylase subunit